MHKFMNLFFLSLTNILVATPQIACQGIELPRTVVGCKLHKVLSYEEPI